MARYRQIVVLCNILFTVNLAAATPPSTFPIPSPTTSSSHCAVYGEEISCEGLTGKFEMIPFCNYDQSYSFTCYNCILENISMASFPSQYSRLEIYSFNVTRSGIKNIGPYAFDALTVCKVLDLSHNGLKSISSTALASLPLQIDTLYLGHNEISELPADVFSKLPKLLTLSLNDNRIANLDYDTFKGLGSLLYLELQNNDICSLPLGIFRGLSGLRELDLTDNKLASLPLGTFSGLTSLTVLRLARNALKYFKGTELLPLHRITEVDVSGNKIGRLDPYNVFANGPTLGRIHIEGNLFSCRRLIEVVQFFKMKHVDVVTEDGRYDVQNVDGVTCTEAERANITASEFLENVVRETKQIARVC